MKKKTKEKKLRQKFFLRTRIDVNFLLAVIFINVIGLVMIYSASYYYAESAYGYKPSHFFENQLLYVLPGIVFMILVSYFRPTFFRKFWYIGLFASLLLLIAVRIPGVGHSSHGAYRWIKIFGFQLQVAEPIKLFMILFLAGAMTAFRITNWKTRLILIGICAVIAGMLLVLSNNMSTAIIVFLMMFFMMMLTYPRTRWFWIAIGIAVSVVLLAVVIILIVPYQPTENFRITRIRAWLDPSNELYVADEAYQATQALYAIASGGFFGKGLGQSLLKFKLPEPHNDYILAIIFEELGIFGVLILTYLFIYLLYKIFRVYTECRDRFSKLMVLGVFFHLAIQITLNYAVTLGLFPTMGVTLPFISAGGASAFFTLAELGLVMSVDRQNTENRLYRQAREEVETDDPYYKQLVHEARELRTARKEAEKEHDNG
ncbi:MAG: cell division protein FtsW [Lachnospiraceae bacterium]|nr:cell division protein FtsW [Lachnospiraceae bacterium]